MSDIKLPLNADMKFLEESNAIESIYDNQSLSDATQAWLYLKKQKRLSKSIMLRTHRILMKRHLGDDAGVYRKVNVRVGMYRAPEWQTIPEKMSVFIKYMNLGLDAKLTEDDIFIRHREFEKIHPFRDGNGRIGRIIYNWDRLKHGFDIDVIYENDKYSYYEKLN